MIRTFLRASWPIWNREKEGNRWRDKTKRRWREKFKKRKKNAFHLFFKRVSIFLCPSSTFFFFSLTNDTKIGMEPTYSTNRTNFSSNLYHHVSFFPFLMCSIEFIPVSKPNFALILNIDGVFFWLNDFFYGCYCCYSLSMDRFVSSIVAAFQLSRGKLEIFCYIFV